MVFCERNVAQPRENEEFGNSHASKAPARSTFLSLLLNPQLKQHVSEHHHLGVILGERSCWSFVPPVLSSLLPAKLRRDPEPTGMISVLLLLSLTYYR